METIEQAYEALRKYGLAFADDRPWDMIKVEFNIYHEMVSASQFLVFKGIKTDVGGFESESGWVWEGLDAVTYIRDYLFKLAGDRIWGLTFTLYPDGKFEIEYNYDKPEDYEETDEVITGEEINQTFLKW